MLKSLRRPSVLRYAAVPAAVLLLTACGSKSDPLAGAGTPAQPSSAPSPSSTSSGGPSSSPTPTAAVAAPPSAAKSHSADGAIAFTKYYFETLVNSAFSTGNVQPLALASDPNCTVCRATIGDAAYFTVTGTRGTGGTVSVSSLRVMSSANSLTSILLSYTSTKLSEVNTDGSTAFTAPGVTNAEVEVQVTWDSSTKAWRMREIVNNPSAPPPSSSTSSPSSTPAP
jgi:hypothetical protein